MALGEFELIRRYFADLGPLRPGVEQGVGDDCALLSLPPGQWLATSIDTMVAGRHFLPNIDPEHLGWRALAAAVSDLAPAGAEPLWFTLALSLPAADPAWLEGFARGLRAGAEAWGLRLVGGDTTAGPLTITLQVMGAAPAIQPITRAGARPGDRVYLSGCTGEAAAALPLLGAAEHTAGQQALLQRYLRPQPRLALGLALRGLATAAVDISDGLLADAGHIAERSGVALRLQAEAIPLAPALLAEVGESQALALALAGGDDYELCFCVPPGSDAILAALSRQLQLPLTCIGEVRAGSGVHCLDRAGHPITLQRAGYEHFG